MVRRHTSYSQCLPSAFDSALRVGETLTTICLSGMLPLRSICEIREIFVRKNRKRP